MSRRRMLVFEKKKKKDKDDKLKMKVYPPNGFSVVSEAEVDVFLDFAFLMTQWTLAICFLVPLPF